MEDLPYDIGGEERWHADSTLAVALALPGLPLIRSADAMEQLGASDGGPQRPTYDRRHGWRVDTPRIPGLTYRTWAEIVAHWEEAIRRIRERQ